MKASQLLLYIGLIIIGFWLLGLVIRIASWAIHIVLVVGLVLVIAWLINEYVLNKKTPPSK